MGSKLLYSAFTTAALITQGCQTLGQTNAPTNQSASVTTASVWASMLEKNARPYNFLPAPSIFTNICMPSDINVLPAGNITAVQIESEYNSYNSFLLRYGRDKPFDIAKQHGQAAASILSAAAKRSGFEIPVYYMESPNSLDNWVLDPTRPDTQALFSSAHVVCLSMNQLNEGRQENQSSSGRLATYRHVVEAQKFWSARTNTIMVQSAGNRGEDANITLERHIADHFLYAPNYVQVGEARITPNGVPAVREHSSRSGPALVVKNPFSEGFKHRYFFTGEDLRVHLDKVFKDSAPDSDKTVVKTFDETVGIYARELRKWLNGNRDSRPDNPFTRTHRRLLTLDFEDKVLLLSDDPDTFAEKNLPAVRQAYVNALVAAAAIEHKNKGANDEGFVGNLEGTSFAAPEASGMIVGQYQLHPNLGAGNLLSAAFIAAEPVDLREVSGCYDVIEYTDNGSGLPVNDRVAGFGYLDERAYAAELQILESLETKNLSIAETSVSTGLRAWPSFTHKDDPKVPAGKREHRFKFEQGGLVRKFQLALLFTSVASSAPEIVTLINPMGKAVDISPTKPGGGTVSVAMTDLHFGVPVAGEWRLQIPEHYLIDLAQADVTGPVAGGAVAARLQMLRDHIQAPTTAVAEYPQREYSFGPSVP